MVIKKFKIILFIFFCFFTFTSNVFALGNYITSWTPTITCSSLPLETSYDFSTPGSNVFKRNTNFSLNIESQIMKDYTTGSLYYSTDFWTDEIGKTKALCTKRATSTLDGKNFFLQGFGKPPLICGFNYTTPTSAGEHLITLYVQNNNGKTAECRSGKTTIKIQVKPTLSYDANNATSGAVPPFQFVDNFAHNSGSATTSANTGDLTKTDHTFAGWYTNSTGTGGTDYPVGSSITFTSDIDITLYAKWVPNSVSRDLIYDPNGGTGAPLSESHLAESIFSLSSIVPIRTSYNFGGWNTNNTGTGTNYSSGASYTMPNVNTTLYAKWTQNSIPCSYDYEWGECIDGTQSPTLVTSYPVGCIESLPPLTSQSCTVLSPEVNLIVEKDYPTELIPKVGTTSLMWAVLNAFSGCTVSNDGDDEKWDGLINYSEIVGGRYYPQEVGNISKDTTYNLDCCNDSDCIHKELLIPITDQKTESLNLNCEAQFNRGNLGKVFVGKQMNWRVSGITKEGNYTVNYRLNPPMNNYASVTKYIYDGYLDIFNNYTYVGTKNFDINIEYFDQDANIKYVGSCNNASTVAVPYDGTVIER